MAWVLQSIFGFVGKMAIGVASGFDDAYETVQGLFADWLTWFANFFYWLFNPSQWLNSVTQLYSWTRGTVLEMLPEPIAEQINTLASWIEDGHVQNAYSLLCYFLRPIIQTDVLQAGIVLIVGVWVISILIKLVFYIKGHFWSSSA